MYGENSRHILSVGSQLIPGERTRQDCGKVYRPQLARSGPQERMDIMPETNLEKIANDFALLEKRFNRYGEQAAKSCHLAINLASTDVRAGRLLVDGD